MCRRPCTAIPTRTGARCDCASPGGIPRPLGHRRRQRRRGRARHRTRTRTRRGGRCRGRRPGRRRGDGRGPEGTDGSAPSEDTVAGADGAPEGAAGAAAALSEAEAELAAQRELRERIEKRKAEKEGPIAAGAKLSGPAADLLAAVRAVESGEKPSTAFFDSPAPSPARRSAPAPTPVRERAPEPVHAPQDASPEAVAAVAAVLAEGGAPEALATPAAGTLGGQAGEILRADPWQLLALPGVGPEQADGFARALLGAGCGPDDERRTAALVGWLLERAALQGHTALDAEQVRAALTGRAVADPDAAVQHAIAEGVVLVFQDGPEGEQTDDSGGTEEDAEPAAEQEPVQVFLGLDRYALAEESLADGLARLVNACEKDADWSDAAAAAPSPSAAELIRTAAAHGLVAHTGGEAARAEPAALIAAAGALGLRALGATHSVDGRQRLAGAVGDPSAAVTLAGLLSGAEGPGRDEEGHSPSTCSSCWTPLSWTSRPAPCWWSPSPTAPGWCSAAIRACWNRPVRGGCSPMSWPPAPAPGSSPAPRTPVRSASWSPASASGS